MESTAPAGPAQPLGASAPTPGPVTPAPGPGRTPRDMALSLIVLMIPVVLIVLAYNVLERGDDPVVVDSGEVLTQARAAGAFPVAEPRGLDSGWRSVSAVFRRGDDGAVLRLGYLTPSGAGVQAVQSNRPAPELITRELTGAARPHGTATVAGRQWQRYRARPGEVALVLLEPERTMIVVGPAGEAELARLATALS